MQRREVLLISLILILISPRLLFLPSKIAAAEIFLEPYVQAAEQITAAHFSHAQFRFTGATIAPDDGNDGP